MKFKLKELQQIYNNLNQIGQIEIKQQTAYWLNRFQDKIETEIKQFNKSREALERRYGAYKFKHGSETLTMAFKNPEDKYGYWTNAKGDKVEGIEANPGQIYWKAENEEKFGLYIKELESLEENQITIDFNPVKVSELVNGRGEPISIRANLFRGLESIIIE